MDTTRASRTSTASRPGRRIAPHRDRAGGARTRELGRDETHVTRPEHRVRRDHETRQLGTRAEPSLDGVGGAENGGLTDRADVEPEGRTVPGEPLDLLGQMSGHEPHSLALRRTKVVEERCQHGAAVDRQDGLRPTLAHGP
jgi:hypothetical protein